LQRFSGGNGGGKHGRKRLVEGDRDVNDGSDEEPQQKKKEISVSKWG
jgi:hypothetical protein